MYRVVIRAPNKPDQYLAAGTYGFFAGDLLVAGKWALERAIELSIWAMLEWPGVETALDQAD